MGIAERRGRHRERLRREILGAARSILVTEGFAHFTMRNIAQRIEYSPTTIYLYFRNREELLHQLCEEVYGALYQTLDRAASLPGSPLKRLHASLRAYVEFGLADPTRYRVAFMTRVGPGIDVSSFLEEGKQARRTYDRMRQCVGEALRAAGAPLEVDATVQALWSLVHGLVALLNDHPHFPWVEQGILVERSLDLALRGLRPTRRRPAAAPPARGRTEGAGRARRRGGERG